MKNFTTPGMNRTGMATSPVDAAAMMELEDMIEPPTSDRTLEDVRVEYAETSEPMTRMPPPASFRELGKTAVKMLKGEKETVFVDKLGERLAFERVGVRLYDGLLSKFDAFGSWEGGPSRDQLDEIRSDELAHMHLVRECIEELGSDPTAMTPSANLLANISMGIPHVIADPRVDLRQSLEAVLVAELADNACWETLIDMATVMGHAEMAERFEKALANEHRHLRRVRGWISAAIGMDAVGSDQLPRRQSLSADLGLGDGAAAMRRQLSRKRPSASAKTSKRKGNGASKRR